MSHSVLAWPANPIQSDPSLMRRVFSTQLFGRSRLTTALLDRMARVGVQEVELHCSLPHLNYRQRSQVEELGHWFRDSEMRVTALHTPVYYDESENVHSFVSITCLEKAERIKATDEIKRALEVADVIPCEFVVQHVGVEDEEYDQDRADGAFNALDELNVFSGQLGTELLLENGANSLSSASKLNLLVGMTHLKNGYCFNVGAAHRADGVLPEFEAMQDRIRMVHLNDNDGVADLRRAPLVESGGSIDWAEAVHALATLSAGTPWGMDLSEDPEREKPVVLAADSFSRLEELLAND
jgi:sugar phosphate isomerase/epimerase